MSEIITNNPWLNVPEQIGLNGSKSGGTRTRLLAATLSALLPGLGQWKLKAQKRAIGFGSGTVVYIVIYIIFRVPKAFLLAGSFVWLLFGLCCWSACDALFHSEPHKKRAPLLWLFVAVPVAFLLTAFHTNLLFRAAGFRNFVIPSSSMQNTIMLGDQLMADLRAYKSKAPQSGDIVLFHHEGILKLKRLIAIGPCTVSGSDGQVFVDGKLTTEEHAIHSDPNSQPGIDLMNFGPVAVPVGSVFVIGDNRDVSLDSRTFGPIPQSSIFGKAIYIIRPLSRGGTALR